MQSMMLFFRDDDGKLRMEEIREVYKDILAEYPNCGGFERNVDKFMAEVKRIDQTFYVVSSKLFTITWLPK